MKERNLNSAIFNTCMVIILSIMLIVCAIYEDEIDSFFGYDVQENTVAYKEASFRQRPRSPFAASGHSDTPDGKGDAGPTPSPTSNPEPTSKSTIEPSPESPSAPTPDSTVEPTAEPTPTVVSTQTPETTPAPAPVASLDLFSCLGIYEDGNGNSIELRLSTEFHTMSYAMRFHYNHGTAGLRGRDGQRTISDNSYVLFTVDYDGEEYPFTIQLGDACILVDDSNCFGPFDGHEFAGTYYMTQQF